MRTRLLVTANSGGGRAQMIEKKLRIFRNRENTFVFNVATCCFTKSNNIIKTKLKKYYSEALLNEYTFWQSIKQLGEIEEYDVHGNIAPYLKLGKSHYGASLLKDVNKTLSGMQITSYSIFISKTRPMPLIVELNNGWFLLIAPCDVREFDKVGK